MNKFIKELDRELKKRLPQSTEYGWSRRIEGALERNEQSAPHDDVAIIVDGEIGSEEYEALSGGLYEYLRKDEYFKRSYYRILLWKNDKLSLVSPKRISNVAHIKKYFEEITVGEEAGSSWETFWQLYKPHKRAGQVVLITNNDKVESMKQSKIIGVRNLLVIYQGNADSQIRSMASTVPCIAFVVKEEAAN
ncbi:MAG: hypothetical protein IJ526_00920 [Lachnospiraceae bacterium]|nr:hypothetical protein [Lachnospiraceae bacterium]